MPPQTAELAVRGHDRFQCDLNAQISIAPEHARLVRPDKSAPGAGGPISVRAVDMSMGGIGVRSPLFVPQTCKIVLVLQSQALPTGLKVPLRVQRVMMHDHAPTYYLGTALDQASAEQMQSIASVIAHLKSTGATLVPEKPRA